MIVPPSFKINMDYQMAGQSFTRPIVPPYYNQDCRISYINALVRHIVVSFFCGHQNSLLLSYHRRGLSSMRFNLYNKYLTWLVHTTKRLEWNGSSSIRICTNSATAFFEVVVNKGLSGTGWLWYQAARPRAVSGSYKAATAHWCVFWNLKRNQDKKSD